MHPILMRDRNLVVRLSSTASLHREKMSLRMARMVGAVSSLIRASRRCCSSPMHPLSCARIDYLDGHHDS